HHRRVPVDDRALVLVQKHQIVRSAAQHLDEMPEDGQARVTDGRLEAAARWRVGQLALRELSVQQPALYQAQAGEVVHRRGEATPRLVEQVMRGADGGGHKRSFAGPGYVTPVTRQLSFGTQLTAVKFAFRAP